MQMKTKRLVLGLARALVFIGLAWIIRERAVATQAAGWVAAGWALSAIVVVKMVLLARKAARGWRQHTAQGVNLASMDAAATASMPSWVQGWYAMEKIAYRSSWRAIKGAPLQKAGPFGVAGGANGGKRTISLLMSAVLCAAAIGYSLPHYFSPFWPLAGACAGLAVAFFYALVWIVGDRRSLKEGGHAVGGGVLLLDLGLRARAGIALSAVTGCVAIGGRAGRDCVWRLNAGEHPNVALDLALATPAVVRGLARDIPPGRVLLYVDDPAGFVAAVNRARVAERMARPSPAAALAGLD